jgi:hypothetical protein
MPRLATAAVELTMLAAPSTGWDSGAGPAPAAAPGSGQTCRSVGSGEQDWLLPAGSPPASAGRTDRCLGASAPDCND